jgi:hypothetical protein
MPVLLRTKRCSLHFLAFLLALGVVAAYAGEAASFTAVSSVSLLAKATSKNQVTISFSARVFNNSPADVNNATIILQHAILSKPMATFRDISIPKGGSVTLNQEISVPKVLYSSWNKGNVLAFQITAKDGDGNQTHHLVPLATQP